MFCQGFLGRFKYLFPFLDRNCMELRSKIDKVIKLFLSKIHFLVFICKVFLGVLNLKIIIFGYFFSFRESLILVMIFITSGFRDYLNKETFFKRKRCRVGFTYWEYKIRSIRLKSVRLRLLTFCTFCYLFEILV